MKKTVVSGSDKLAKYSVGKSKTMVSKKSRKGAERNDNENFQTLENNSDLIISKKKSNMSSDENLLLVTQPSTKGQRKSKPLVANITSDKNKVLKDTNDFRPKSQTLPSNASKYNPKNLLISALRQGPERSKPMGSLYYLL